MAFIIRKRTSSIERLYYSSSHQTKDATLTTAWLAIWALGFAMARRLQNRPQKVEVVQSWFMMDDGCWRWPSKQRGLYVWKVDGKKSSERTTINQFRYSIYADVFFPLQNSVFFLEDSWLLDFQRWKKLDDSRSETQRVTMGLACDNPRPSRKLNIAEKNQHRKAVKRLARFRGSYIGDVCYGNNC